MSAPPAAPQSTLARSSAPVTGFALDGELSCTVRFHPAPADHGLVFVRADLPGSPEVSCLPANVRPQSRWSSLAQGGAWVHHTEHVLAALYGRGLDNVRIELQQDRVPVVSAGSCAGFWDALAEAGTASQDAPRRVFRLTRAVRQTTALAAPAGAPGVIAAGACRELLAYPAETFSATYVFDVPHLPGMHRGLADYDSGEPFMERVGAARTYVLAVERSSLGAILDVTGRDVIVLTPDSPQPLVDEVARHKLLDLVGDLALLGRPLLARVVALRTGHTAHHDFLRLLTASGALELWPA